MTVRDSVIEFLKTLPEDTTLEDIMYHLYVREKIFRGEKQLDEGLGIPHEEIEAESQKWFD